MPGNGPTTADQRAGEGSGGSVNLGGFFTWGRDILSTLFNPKGGGNQPQLTPEQLRNQASQAADRKRLDSVAETQAAAGHYSPDVTGWQQRAIVQQKGKFKKLKPGEMDRRITHELAMQGIWPYTIIDQGFTPANIVRTVGIAGETLAMSGGTYRNLPRTPGMGTRSAQRGFTREPVELEPLIAEPMTPAKPTPAKPVRRPGAIPPRRPPVTMPGGAPQPKPKAPDTRTQEYPGSEPATERTRSPATKPVYPGPGPAAPAPSPSRVPGPVGPSTAKPGKTGTGAPVAKPRVGTPGLSVESLLTDALGYLTRRSPASSKASRNAFPGLATTGKPAPRTEPKPLTAYAPGYADPTNDQCDCESKKKPRMPRQPRSQCWTGTYTETKTGLRKARREQVPCS